MGGWNNKWHLQNYKKRNHFNYGTVLKEIKKKNFNNSSFTLLILLLLRKRQKFYFYDFIFAIRTCTLHKLWIQTNISEGSNALKKCKEFPSLNCCMILNYDNKIINSKLWLCTYKPVYWVSWLLNNRKEGGNKSDSLSKIKIFVSNQNR